MRDEVKLGRRDNTEYEETESETDSEHEREPEPEIKLCDESVIGLFWQLQGTQGFGQRRNAARVV